MSTSSTYLTLTLPVGTERRQLSIWNANWNAVDAAFNPSSIGAAGLQVAVLRDTAQTPNYTTSATKMINLTPTWNHNSAHTLIFGNVTDTLSAATAKLIDMQVGSASKWSVDKAGVVIQSSTSATALTIGPNGATNPVVQVDASTGSQAAGLKVTGATAAGTVAVAVISSGADANLSIDAKGTGTITFGSTSTGNIVSTRLHTFSAGATVTGAVTFSTNVISTTALATPSALSATQATLFASTVSGATLMGFGTTNDVTLMNRAGTVVLGVLANSTSMTSAVSVVGSTRTLLWENLDNTNAASHAAIMLRSGASGGDPKVQWERAGTDTWAAGVDVSASGSWKLSYSANLGTSDAITVTTGLAITLGGALALGANNLTMTGTISATGARITKSWHTDITSTNAVVVDSSVLSKVPESIQDYAGDALAILRRVRVVGFRHLDCLDPSNRQKLGVIAETVDEPLALQEIENPSGDGTTYPGVNLMGLIALQTRAIQQLEARLTKAGVS